MLSGNVCVQQSGCEVFMGFPVPDSFTYAKQIEQGSCLSPANTAFSITGESHLKPKNIIELSPGCLRFDSIVDANEKGDAKALRAALEANLATISSILAAAFATTDRYVPTLQSLMADLDKIDQLEELF